MRQLNQVEVKSVAGGTYSSISDIANVIMTNTNAGTTVNTPAIDMSAIVDAFNNSNAGLSHLGNTSK